MRSAAVVERMLAAPSAVAATLRSLCATAELRLAIVLLSAAKLAAEAPPSSLAPAGAALPLLLLLLPLLLAAPLAAPCSSEPP
jgi:hypothetical protein